MLRVSEQNLRDLGWGRVTAALAAHCATPPGQAAALGLRPLSDLAAVQAALNHVHELAALADRGADLPLGGLPDIAPALIRSASSQTLHVEDLYAVTRLAAAAVEVREHLRHHRPTLPSLSAHLSDFPDLTLLASELEATFDAHGQVRDDASPELLEARERLQALHRTAKERLDRFIAQADVREHLQDDFYTQRDDRYVVPVIASFQKEIPGIIHGTSNTGETVFIEPQRFVEINNAIKVAESQVRHALERVLRERSGWIAAEAEALTLALRILVDLDLLQARARLGRAMGGSVPAFADDGRVLLKDARNPYLLLKGTAVVPNTIEIPAGKSFLVVTGPNTGGKTVTLSTVGMCYLMLACALPIPVGDGSVVAPMRSLAALIGDAQDLERDLSTFSGHLEALQSLLDAVEPDSLVLLDEIATGTEPAQGAALAIAVLESLAARGGRGIVTTHYERLKTLPLEDARFTNASVGLDPKSLTPTFILESGRAGASNPFEIALHLGFSPRIIDRARGITTQETGGYSEALARIAAAEDAAAEAEARLKKAEAETRAEGERLRAERERLERLAREEVDALYIEARAELRSLHERLEAHRRELSARFEADRRETATRERIEELARDKEALKEVGEALKAARPGGPKPEVEQDEDADRSGEAGPLSADRAVPGAAVWVRSLGKPAEIVDVRGDRITVAVGALSMGVRLSDLGRLAANAPRPPAARSAKVQVISTNERAPELDLDDVRTPPPQTPDVTVDLRGMRREDVQGEVEPMLDRALREQVEAIWIIHGHGTGAMRTEVREFLARSPYILGYRGGRRNEGGDGVTIAFLHRN